MNDCEKGDLLIRRSVKAVQMGWRSPNPQVMTVQVPRDRFYHPALSAKCVREL